MKIEDAVCEVRRVLEDNKGRQFPFLTKSEEFAIRTLLAGYEAAVREIESMLMDTCDRTRCVNMKCHLDQASCSPIWRGPEQDRVKHNYD